MLQYTVDSVIPPTLQELLVGDVIIGALACRLIRLLSPCRYPTSPIFCHQVTGLPIAVGVCCSWHD